MKNYSLPSLCESSHNVGGGGRNPAGLVFCVNDQGGESLNIEKGGMPPTLRSEAHGNLPVICAATGQSNAEVLSDICPTITEAAGKSGNKPYIAVGVHQNQTGSVNTAPTAYSLATTGNASSRNAPLVAHPKISGTLCASGAGLSRPAGLASETDLCVAYCLQGNMIGRADDNGPMGNGVNTNISFTLNRTDQHAVAARNGFYEPIPIQDKATRCTNGGCGNGLGVGKEGDPAPTITAGDRHALAYSFDSLTSNSMKSSNPKSGCREVDLSRTIDTTVPDPSKNQGGIAIVFESHGQDARYTGSHKTTPPVTASFGLGGGNIPLTITSGVGDYCAVTASDCHTFIQQRSDDYTEDDTASTQVARQCKSATDLVAAVDCRNFKEVGDLSGTLQAKNAPGYSLNYQNPVRTGYIVRRLTPTECERLQGYPDGWTAFGHDGKPMSDTARYQMLGNSVAVPCVAYIMMGIAEQLAPESEVNY